MLSALAITMIDKGILKKEMEVEAKYKGLGLNGQPSVPTVGEFMILDFEKTDDNRLIFKLTSTLDGTKRNLYAESVYKIDGMEADRFAEVYGIKADGSNPAQGKRRGRKPKNRTI